MTDLEDFLGSLRRKRREWLNDFGKQERKIAENLLTYRRVSHSKDSSEAERTNALLGEKVEYESGDRRVDDLLLFDDILVLANYVDMLKATIDWINRQIEESGIFDKIKDLDKVTQLMSKIEAARKGYTDAFEEAENRQKMSQAWRSYIS